MLILAGGALLLAALLIMRHTSDPALDASDPTQTSSTAPQPAPRAAEAAATRTPDRVNADLTAALQALDPVLDWPAVALDPARRRADAEALRGPLAAVLRLLDEQAALSSQSARNTALLRMQFRFLQALIGDPAASTRLAEMARSSDPDEVLAARGIELLLRWWAADGDPRAQHETLDGLEQLARKHPDSDLVVVAMKMVLESGMAAAELTPAGHDTAQTAGTSPGVRQRAEEIVLANLKGEQAGVLAYQIDVARRMRCHEGKPVIIEGARLDGGRLSTEDFKGKVILVEFWATWCGPCIRERPRLKRIHQTYSDKGLQIVGISNDDDPQALRIYLERDPGIAWPQLYDTARPGWHAVATRFDVETIPTMFLIDRQGILRSTEARQHLEAWIERLLNE